MGREMNPLIQKRMNDEKTKVEMKYVVLDNIFALIRTHLNMGQPELAEETAKDDFHIFTYRYEVRVRYENERFHVTVNAMNDNKITGELIMFLTGERDNYIIGNDNKIRRCFDEIGNLMNTITDAEEAKNHEGLV